MPRMYTPEQKAAALRQLTANNGQVLLTSRQTAIPERTLQRWKSLSQPPQNYLSQPPPPAAMSWYVPPSQTEEDAQDDDYEALRQRLLKESLVIADSISDGILEAPVNQRAAILARLIDRLVKLEAHLPSGQIIRFEYEKPEDNPLYRRFYADDEDDDYTPAPTSNYESELP